MVLLAVGNVNVTGMLGEKAKSLMPLSKLRSKQGVTVLRVAHKTIRLQVIILNHITTVFLIVETLHSSLFSCNCSNKVIMAQLFRHSFSHLHVITQIHFASIVGESTVVRRNFKRGSMATGLFVF